MLVFQVSCKTGPHFMVIMSITMFLKKKRFKILIKIKTVFFFPDGWFESWLELVFKNTLTETRQPWEVEWLKLFLRNLKQLDEDYYFEGLTFHHWSQEQIYHGPHRWDPECSEESRACFSLLVWFLVSWDGRICLKTEMSESRVIK